MTWVRARRAPAVKCGVGGLGELVTGRRGQVDTEMAYSYTDGRVVWHSHAALIVPYGASAVHCNVDGPSCRSRTAVECTIDCGCQQKKSGDFRGCMQTLEKSGIKISAGLPSKPVPGEPYTTQWQWRILRGQHRATSCVWSNKDPLFDWHRLQSRRWSRFVVH